MEHDEAPTDDVGCDRSPAAAPPDWSRYGEAIDFDNPSDSRALVLGRLGEPAQRVLELGCSAGLMTAVMQQRGHRVTAVEIDPVAAKHAEPYAERVLVGDLDRLDGSEPDGSEPGAPGRHLLDDLAPGSFDTVIAADVLEHLRDPVGCLRRALDLLTEGGTVILSIPNVAHGDVRMALLEGRFDYRDLGLLDRTHVHMFTLASLVSMLRDVGLAPIAWDRAIRGIGETEIDVDENLVEFGRRVLADDPEASTYQWIVTCRRESVAGPGAVWPEHADRSAAVDGVIEVMNTPVPQPAPPPDADAPSVPSRVRSGLARRLRRGAAAVRERAASTLAR